MTLTKYTDYSELFAGCTLYYNFITLDNLINSGTYNLTQVGSPTLSINRFGLLNKSVTGFSDSIYYTTSNGGFSTSTLTICMWVKSPTSITVNTYPTLITSNTAAQSFIVGQTNTTGNCGFYDGRSGGYYCNSPALPLDGNWHFVVWVTNQSSLCTVYIDVTSVYTATAAYKKSYAIGTVVIGRDITITSRQWVGSFGEFLIYNRVLSATEIKTLYNLTSQKYLFPILPGNRGVC